MRRLSQFFTAAAALALGACAPVVEVTPLNGSSLALPPDERAY